MEWMAKKTFTAPWFCAEQTDESWNREMNCATDAEGSSRSTTVHLPSTRGLILVSTVHDTENLTFSADDRADNPHIAAQPSSYVRADNQRIPRGHLEDSTRTISGLLCETISGFCAEFCEFKTKITQSIDIRTILAVCFSILQPVVVRSSPSGFRHFQPESARKIRACPHG